MPKSWHVIKENADHRALNVLKEKNTILQKTGIHNEVITVINMHISNDKATISINHRRNYRRWEEKKQTLSIQSKKQQQQTFSN